jgi:hypothetical protein
MSHVDLFSELPVIQSEGNLARKDYHINLVPRLFALTLLPRWNRGKSLGTRLPSHNWLVATRQQINLPL